MQVNDYKCYLNEYVQSRDVNTLLEGMDEYGRRVGDVVSHVPPLDLPLLLCAMMNYQDIIEQTMPGTLKTAYAMKDMTGVTAIVLPVKRGDNV